MGVFKEKVSSPFLIRGFILKVLLTFPVFSFFKSATRQKCRYLIWVLLFLIPACKKPYTPVIVNSDDSYLVVEGVINSGNDSTIISLSKTVKIADSARVNPVNGYTVMVEAENSGETYKLKPLTTGKYAIGPMGLNTSKKYRLHISDPDGKEYASEYLEILNNPPIDSISFKPKADNVEVYVSTHDPADKIKYYRWTYEEDWKFHAKSFSEFIVDGDSLRVRKPQEEIYFCYNHDRSGDIRLGSTTKLSQAVISEALVAAIPSASEKISVRYSILVKQYPLTKGAYEFWDNLSKNTEKLGSIFDAQPSLLKGNLTCLSNPAKPVIGYITASNTQVKRFFIDRLSLPADWITAYPFDCAIDKAYFSAPKTGQNQVKDLIINGNGQNIAVKVAPEGYFYTSPRCADCSLRGNLVPPSFWR